MFKGILIYEAKCPFCRRVKRLVQMFDIGRRIQYVPIRSKAARDLLYEFYDHPPYDFHFIDGDFCFTGKKAIPRILQTLFISMIWPYSGIRQYVKEQILRKEGNA